MTTKGFSDSSIDHLGEMLFSDVKFEAVDGRTQTYKEYLDGAIEAFGLNPFDYFTVHYMLMKVIDGQSGDEISEAIKKNWSHVFLKHGRLPLPNDEL